MKVGFRQSFEKDVSGVRDKGLLRRVKAAVEAVEKSGSLSQISGLKKLKGGGNFYRLRIGDFRIGLAVESGKVIFVRFIDRKDMYRYFP